MSYLAPLFGVLIKNQHLLNLNEKGSQGIIISFFFLSFLFKSLNFFHHMCSVQNRQPDREEPLFIRRLLLPASQIARTYAMWHIRIFCPNLLSIYLTWRRSSVVRRQQASETLLNSDYWWRHFGAAEEKKELLAPLNMKSSEEICNIIQMLLIFPLRASRLCFF